MHAYEQAARMSKYWLESKEGAPTGPSPRVRDAVVAFFTSADDAVRKLDGTLGPLAAMAEQGFARLILFRDLCTAGVLAVS